MNRDVIAGIICMSLIVLYNYLLKTNLSNKSILAILGGLFGISLLLTLPSVNFTWLLSVKIIIFIILLISFGLVLYKARKKK